MGDNGELKTQKEKAEEKPELLPKEEVKKETPPPPPTEFKIAEIWFRQGKVFIDAQQEFWQDKCRALGLLEYCKDIVKEARTAPEPKIMPARGNMMKFAHNVFKRRR